MTRTIEELRREREELLAKQARYLKVNGGGFDPYALKLSRIEREIIQALGVSDTREDAAPAKGEAEWTI